MFFLQKSTFPFFLFLLLSFNIAFGQNTPCTAIALTVNDADFQTFSTAGLNNSGVPNPMCGGNISSDIWFEATSTSTGYLNIITLANTITDAAMAVYTGSCNNLEEVTCSTDDHCGSSIMPIIHFYDLPPGTTYYIRIWNESGGSGNFDIQVLDHIPQPPMLNLVTVGDATISGSNCVQLTTEQTGLHGCAWDPTQVDFTQPIENTFSLNFGTIDANGADGICLVYQNDPNGLSTCGITGGGLASSGIANSFIIEFDTWDNGAGVNDIAQDHVAISVNGNIDAPINGPFSLGNIEDGNDHIVLFTWDPVTNFYEVFFDGNLVASGNYDIVNNCFGGNNMAYCGFTASTGGSVNNQFVCFDPPVTYPSGIEEYQEMETCASNPVFIGGAFQNTSGVYHDYFSNSEGCDSIITTTLTVYPVTYSFFQDTICEGECLTFSGEVFCDSGPHQIVRTNSHNCDSIITLDIVILYPVVQILPTDVITCNNQDALLDGSFSDNGPGYSYQWTGPEAGCISGNANDLVTTGTCEGTYQLEVFQMVGDHLCSNTAEVEVFADTVPPAIHIAPPEELSCAINCIMLDASGSDNGNFYNYEWSGTDDFSSFELNPTVCNPGTYYLTIEDEITGCSRTDSIVVAIDSESPVADAGTDLVLTCLQPSVTLNGQNSSTGNNFQLHWEDINGNFLTGNPTLDVAETGLFTIVVSSTSNGCVERDTVAVIADFAPPTAVAVTGGILDCSETPVFLDGSNSSSIQPVSYNWQNPVGQNIGIDTVIAVQHPGVYQLIVHNQINGCADTTTVEVSSNTTPPVADAGENGAIDCLQEEVLLSAQGSEGQGMLAFQWIGSTQNIVGSEMTYLATTPGIYTLITTDIINSCRDTAFVEVSDNRIFPEADAGMDAILNCYSPTVTLGSTNSSVGANFTYNWIDENNQTAGNEINLQVAETGVYTLIVTDTTNFCVEMDEVTVAQNFTTPVVDAGEDKVLNCENNSATLDGGNSSAGTDFSYEWTDSSGVVVGAMPQITVTQPGLYYLSVTNFINGCSAKDSLQVHQDENFPIAQIADVPNLDCNTTSLVLDAQNSSQGANITYRWIDENMNVLGTGSQLAISMPGDYLFEVTNSDNNCQSTASIQVEIDTISPVFILPEDEMINCYQPEITIGDDMLNDSLNWMFVWEDESGLILGNAPTLVISHAGNYRLVVQNQTNGCSHEEAVNVNADFDYPVADAGEEQTLDCVQTTVLLGGDDISEGININYQWYDESGQLISESSLFEAGEPGTFTLIVSNESNGCRDTSGVIVSANQLVPFVTATVDEPLTCTRTSVPIDATGSDFGDDYIANWNVLSGAPLQFDDNPLLPMALSPGQYRLVLTNTQNGCADTTEVVVLQDVTSPLADAGDDFELDCLSPVAELDGAASSPADISYLWTTEDGQINGAEHTAHPVISMPGIYHLEVTDQSNGCTDEDEVLVTSNFITDFDVVVGQPKCVGDLGSIYIEDIVGGHPPFLYSIDDGDSFSAQNIFSPLQAGVYPVVVQDVNGCESEKVAEVNAPEAVVVFLPELDSIRLGEVYQLKAQTNLLSEEIGAVGWTPTETLSCDTCLITEAMPFVTTTYQVTVIDTNGCSNLASITLLVDKRPHIFVPNVFSPNGDGNNDIFYIFSDIKDEVTIKSLQIFSRWGEKVFEVYDFLPNDPAYGWNGLYRGRLLNPAVFVWYAEIEFIDGRVELFKGDVVLVR